MWGQKRRAQELALTRAMLSKRLGLVVGPRSLSVFVQSPEYVGRHRSTNRSSKAADGPLRRARRRLTTTRLCQGDCRSDYCSPFRLVQRPTQSGPIGPPACTSGRAPSAPGRGSATKKRTSADVRSEPTREPSLENSPMSGSPLAEPRPRPLAGASRNQRPILAHLRKPLEAVFRAGGGPGQRLA